MYLEKVGLLPAENIEEKRGNAGRVPDSFSRWIARKAIVCFCRREYSYLVKLKVDALISVWGSISFGTFLIGSICKDEMNDFQKNVLLITATSSLSLAVLGRIFSQFVYANQ